MPLVVRQPMIIRHLGVTDFETTWHAMQRFTANRSADTPDELWLTEHPPVYTLGLNRKQHAINGTLRATYFEPSNAKKMRDWGLVELSDRPDDEYRVNVQIAELKALNACPAVVRYKQLKGFCLDENNFDHMLFKVNDIKVHGEAR